MKICFSENKAGGLEGSISFTLVSGGKKQEFIEQRILVKNHKTTSQDKLLLLEKLIADALSKLMAMLKEQIEFGVPSKMVSEGVVYEIIKIEDGWHIE